jgi:hypothetical protein
LAESNDFATIGSKEFPMGGPNPFVLESFRTIAVCQALAEIDANEKGDRINAHIFRKAAAETREAIEHYKHRSIGGSQ